MIDYCTTGLDMFGALDARLVRTISARLLSSAYDMVSNRLIDTHHIILLSILRTCRFAAAFIYYVSLSLDTLRSLCEVRPGGEGWGRGIALGADITVAPRLMLCAANK